MAKNKNTMDDIINDPSKMKVFLKQQDEEWEKEFQEEGPHWSLKGGEFTGYLWHYYKPKAIYGEFFNHTLTKEEVLKGIKQYRAKYPKKWGEGDSMDREWVRDIMIKNRDPNVLTEHHNGWDWWDDVMRKDKKKWKMI